MLRDHAAAEIVREALCWLNRQIRIEPIRPIRMLMNSHADTFGTNGRDSHGVGHNCICARRCDRGEWSLFNP
jgi:hypothetical protein